MTVANIPIQGTFDIALARSILRKKSAERGWQPGYRARAAGALTCLAEIILMSHSTAMLNLSTNIVNGRERLEIACDIRQQSDQNTLVTRAQQRLGRFADEVMAETQDNNLHITACLWLP